MKERTGGRRAGFRSPSPSGLTLPTVRQLPARLGALYVAERAAFRYQARTAMRSAGLPENTPFSELRRTLRSHLADQVANLLPGAAELEPHLRLGAD